MTVYNIIVDGKILAQYRKVYPAPEAVLYFYVDNLSSRRVVLNATGAVQDRIRYSVWGMATQDLGSDDLRSFTGKDYDASGLIYFNARYYEPTTGRFLTEDPAKKGGNWYAYCGDDPVNFTDPTGLEEKYVGSTLTHVPDQPKMKPANMGTLHRLESNNSKVEAGARAWTKNNPSTVSEKNDRWLCVSLEASISAAAVAGDGVAGAKGSTFAAFLDISNVSKPMVMAAYNYTLNPLDAKAGGVGFFAGIGLQASLLTTELPASIGSQKVAQSFTGPSPSITASFDALSVSRYLGAWSGVGVGPSIAPGLPGSITAQEPNYTISSPKILEF